SLGIFAAFGFLGKPAIAGTGTGSGGNGGKVPTFTLDQAILTALQQNPDLLRAEQEIKRTKGVILQVRAQALPHIDAAGNFQWTDPNLTGSRVFGTTNTTGGGTTTGGSTATGGTGSAMAQAAPAATPGATNVELSDVSYAISV